MKRFLLSFLILLCSNLIFAQRAFKLQHHANTQANLRILSCGDTLGLCAYDTVAKAIYRDQLGGYAVGTNFFGDLAKAQEFQFDDSIRYNIRKVLFYFGAKKTAVPDSFLIINIYKIDSLGYTANSTTRACPDTILASRKLYLDSIDTIAGHATIVDFQWGVSTKGKFAVGFDMSHLDTADRVGLYSSKDSTAGKTELAWEKQGNGRWYSLLRSWPLDVNLAIFPIVDKTAIGIAENTASKIDALHLLPNPANGLLQINFKAEKAETCQLLIFDQLNRLVMKTSFNTTGKGIAKFDLNTAELDAGYYTCSIQSASGSWSKKLIVQH